MNAIAEDACVEGSRIRPNRSWRDGSVSHARSQKACRRDFPFHVQDCSSSRHSEFDAEVETADAGAEAENGKIHTSPPKESIDNFTYEMSVYPDSKASAGEKEQ